MKKLLLSAFALLALAAPPLVSAWTYHDGDALLIFRESGFDDVEFDIGSVNQFLNHPAGYSATVTGWSLNLVTNVFGSDLTGVSVVVTATTPLTNSSLNAWLSSAPTVTSVNDVTASTWQFKLWSIIDSLGTRPTNYNTTPAGTNAYDIDPSGNSRLTSYDYIVTGGGVNANAISEFGGNADFAVEGVAPTTFGFWQIQPTNATPKPSATFVGNFTISAGGALVFKVPTAPATPSVVQGITRNGGVTTVNFSTDSAGHFSLVYSPTLGSPIPTWSVVSGPVAGNGASQSLSHTNSSAQTGYYGILRSP